MASCRFHVTYIKKEPPLCVAAVLASTIGKHSNIQSLPFRFLTPLWPVTMRYLSCGDVLRVFCAQVSLANVSFKKRCASGNPQAIGRQNLLGRQKTVLFDGVVKEPVIALFECLGPDRFVAGVVFRTKTGGFVFP